MPKRISELEHCAIMEMLGNALYAQDRNEKLEDLTDIKVDTDGLHRPSEITMPGFEEGDVPDATAMGKQLYVYEVETPDSIKDEHTEQQWTLFASYAAEKGGKFIVAVPPMSVNDAKDRLKELSLEGTVIAVP